MGTRDSRWHLPRSRTYFDLRDDHDLIPPQKPDGLLPNYVQPGGADFSDGAASSALASVAYRAATLWPKQFGANYTRTASKKAT